MTTATRPTPEHGDRACYQRGCDRPECSEAHRRYMKRYRLDRARNSKRRVAAAPVAAQVRALSAAGWSHRQIADAAQCSRRQISSLVNDSNPTVHADLAARIAAARPTISAAPARTSVDATGTIRRIHALHAIGHALIDISTAAGLSKGALGRIINHGHDRLTAESARAVADAYSRLAKRPGTNARARNRAAREGWHDPLWWDDMGRIDDPTFDPATAEAPLKKGELGAHRREEIRHLASYGIPEADIATRLGMATGSVRDILAELRAGQRRDRSKQAAA